MSTTTRFLTTGIVLGLAAGVFVGAGLLQPGRAAAVTPSTAPAVFSPGAVTGAPAAVSAVTKGGTTNVTAVSSGPAIAYPFLVGSPGVAPDHTIVVTGVGQADVQSDGSDRASAQRTALAAALADAKAQATEIASATGLSISGVLSVSAAVSPSYGVVPMAGSASGSGPTEPVTPVAPLPQPVYPQSLSVSVTVAYSVN